MRQPRSSLSTRFEKRPEAVADLVNLRQARKAKARRDASTQAEANRRLFGRSKNERTVALGGRELEARRLDGHLREKTVKESPIED